MGNFDTSQVEAPIGDMDDRRTTHRVAGKFSDREDALLVVRGRDIAVHLIDQSIGGFSIELPADNAKFEVGDHLYLGVRSSWHGVEVANTRPVADQLRVGLRLLEDTDVSQLKAVRSRYIAWRNYLLTTGAVIIFALCLYIHFTAEDPRDGVLHHIVERCLRMIVG